jgi:hypothetical protein
MTMTIAQTDTIILEAGSAHGAIEDAEVSDTSVTYFFEDGMMGTVCRQTGAVTFTSIDQ